MAEEDNTIQAQQISQNYLIDPADIIDEENQRENQFEDAVFPEADQTTSAEDISSGNVDLDVRKNISPDSIKSIPIEEMENLKKQIEKMNDMVDKTMGPSIDNLYKVVSAMANKNTSPQSFTEERTAFDNSLLFFNKESSRVSQKMEWA